MGYRGISQPYYGSPYPVVRPTGPSVPAAGAAVRLLEDDDARGLEPVRIRDRLAQLIRGDAAVLARTRHSF